MPARTITGAMNPIPLLAFGKPFRKACIVSSLSFLSWMDHLLQEDKEEFNKAQGSKERADEIFIIGQFQHVYFDQKISFHPSGKEMLIAHHL